VKAFNFKQYIEDHTLRCEAGYRGGGIEIDATDYLGYNGRYELHMTAYQNYLGGGMLGSVQGSIEGKLRDYPKSIQAKALKLNEQLKRYFHGITNHEDNEWESASYEDNQNRPESAY
jgi:hypothetical protein